MYIQPDIETFKLALDNATNHIIFTDVEGKITYANHGAEIATGYTKDEMIGQNPKLWGGQMGESFYKKMWQTIKIEQKPFTAEVKNKNKNGNIYFSLIHISPIKDTQGKLTGFIATEENISEIKKLTETLAEQKIFLRKVIDTDPNMIFAKDWEGRFTLANKAVAAVYGTTPEGLLGKSDSDFNKNVKEVQHFIKDDQHVMKSKKPKLIAEEPVTNPSTGQTKWYQTIKTPLLMSTQPIQILGVATDITERKLDEELIIIEKLKDDAILASIGEGLIATDEFGQVTLMNHTAETLTGWKLEELKGKKLIKNIPLLDETDNIISPASRAMTMAIKQAKQTVISSYYYLRKNKTKFPISATITPIIFNNKIIGSIEIFRDITHEKDVDKAKSEFVSLAAHQLRAPLTAISWYSEYLLSPNRKNDPKMQKKYLEEIYHANKRMVKLVDSLLNVSRVELGTFMIEPVEIDLVKMAKNIIDELSNQITQKKLNIKERYSSSSIIVKADLNLVRIILQNLLTNAIKYSYVEGQIDLKIEEKDKIIIEVRDSGIGIEKKDQSKIFTKFFRGDNAKSMDPEGNGLGLYIIKSLLGHTKGRIWYETSSKGSAFYVTFPKGGMTKKKGTKKIE